MSNSSNILVPTITIAISTIAKNLDNFIKYFSFISLREADQVIIIIQGDIQDDLVNKLDESYLVINDNGSGISRSRNIGISNANCDYIWFLDDDILLDNDAVVKVKDYISKYHSDILTVRMAYIENGRPYKSYPNKLILDRLNILNISSVEAIVSKKVLTQSKVRFNESLGLGTKYPSCEENIFLLDLFDFGAEIIHIPEYVQKHPLVNRRIYFKNPKILFAKGVFCKRYNGFMGIVIMFFWFFKSLICGSKFKDCYNLIYGYNSAVNILD